MTPRPSRRIDVVTPGYYRFRQTRGGPWVAAVVSITDGMIQLLVDGSSAALWTSLGAYEDIVVDEVMDGAAFSNPLLRVLWFGELIEEGEYRYMLRMSAWAREQMPSHPAAKPGERVDMATVPIETMF